MGYRCVSTSDDPKRLGSQTLISLYLRLLRGRISGPNEGVRRGVGTRPVPVTPVDLSYRPVLNDPTKKRSFMVSK